ncbi:hypothetical protein LZ31DRAFT_322452 [Colletotrichum somersetense]|nr:hypothetical protein LZ31DRAFT_322452 [Colletotrichum somersetense]
MCILVLRSVAAAAVVRKKGPDHAGPAPSYPSPPKFRVSTSPVLSCKNDAGGTQPGPFPNQGTADALEQKERERKRERQDRVTARLTAAQLGPGIAGGRRAKTSEAYTWRHLRRSPSRSSQPDSDASPRPEWERGGHRPAFYAYRVMFFGGFFFYLPDVAQNNGLLLCRISYLDMCLPHSCTTRHTPSLLYPVFVFNFLLENKKLIQK